MPWRAHQPSPGVHAGAACCWQMHACMHAHHGFRLMSTPPSWSPWEPPEAQRRLLGAACSTRLCGQVLMSAPCDAALLLLSWPCNAAGDMNNPYAPMNDPASLAMTGAGLASMGAGIEGAKASTTPMYGTYTAPEVNDNFNNSTFYNAPAVRSTLWGHNHSPGGSLVGKGNRSWRNAGLSVQLQREPCGSRLADLAVARPACVRWLLLFAGASLPGNQHLPEHHRV